MSIRTLRVLRAFSVLSVLSFSPLAGAATGCEHLNGTYEYQSSAPRNGTPEYLSNFVQGRDKAKLVVRESGGAPKGLSGGGVLSRPKVTHLASAVTVTYRPAGTKMRFLEIGRASCRER